MTRQGSRIQREVYDNWRGNFRSKLRHFGHDPRSYMAQNLQVYEDGTLGPRPWLRLRDTTGLTTSDTIDNLAFCQYRDNGGSAGELWMHGYSGDVWYYDFSADTWAASTSADAQVTASGNQANTFGSINDWENSGLRVGSTQYTVTTEDNYVFSGEALINDVYVASAITWSASGGEQITNTVLYRDRIWGWQNANTTNANRLQYTNAGSYTTSDAGNYIDIGPASDGYYIRGCWALRDSLLICMSNGDWFVFTGTPDSGSLRFIGTYVTPASGAGGAVLNNAVYFLIPNGRQVAIATPSGVDTTTLMDIRPWLGDTRWTIFHDYRGLASQTEQSLLLPTLRSYTDQQFFGIELVNGAWTYSGFGVDRFSDGVGNASNLGYLRDCAVVGQGRAYAFMMEDPDDPGSHEMQLYTRDIVLNRPSRSTDEWSDSKEVAAGDTATGLARGGVRLAPYAPPGEEVRVRQVTVDFFYWHDDSTTYETPDMRCVLVDGATTGLESIDTFTMSGFDSFEDAGKTSDWAHGLPGRWIFRFPLEDQDFRQAIQVQVDDIMSLAISRIIVDYEIRPDNHWGGQMGGT